MSTSFQLDQIHSPTPENNDLSRHSRLAPHDSIMEALNMDNLDLFNNQNLASSWQSVGSAILSRPTSSVLSSDGTDDEVTNLPLAKAPCQSIQLNDDDRTIEIDMNSKITKMYTTTTSSAFVMPDIVAKDNLFFEHENNKILIIGHKKSAFFKSFAQKQRSRFTLNAKDSYNIILVIFDGLIKIGNIIRFIKKARLNQNDKPLIPVFRNINWEIIEQILESYKIDKLLCSPIHYDDKFQVQRLVENLIDDYILPYDLNLGNGRALKPSSAENSLSRDFLEHNNSPSIRFKANGPPIGNNSIIVKHHVLNSSPSTPRYLASDSEAESRLLKKSSQSKKIQSRESKKKKYYILSFSLTLGVGIGVATAYASSLIGSNPKDSLTLASNYPVTLEAFFVNNPNDLWFDNPLKNLGHIMANFTRATGRILKDNMIDVADTAFSCSSFLVNEIGLAAKNIKSLSSYWLGSLSSGGFNSSSLMWSF